MLSVGTADNAPSYDIVYALDYNVMSSTSNNRMMKKTKSTAAVTSNGLTQLFSKLFRNNKKIEHRV